MPRWLVLLLAGLLTQALGWTLLNTAARDPGLQGGWIVVSSLLITVGVWLLVVAAVSLGVQIAHDAPGSRMARIEQLLRPPEPVRRPTPEPDEEVPAAVAVEDLLRRRVGATVDEMVTGTGLPRTEVRLGLAHLDRTGRLRADEHGRYFLT